MSKREPNAPPATEVLALVRDMREGRERLRALAAGRVSDGRGDFDEVVDRISEQMLVADEELRAQAEQLEQSSRRLDLLVALHEELFAGAPTPYLQTDADGSIVRYNRAAQQLLSLAPLAGRSRTVANLVRPADRPAVRNLLSRLRSEPAGMRAADPPQLVEVTVQTPDDRLVRVVISGRRSSDAGSGRSLMHLEVQPTAPAAPAPQPATELTAADRSVAGEDVVRVLTDAVADIAQQDSPSATIEHVAAQAHRAVAGCDEVAVTIVRRRNRLETPVVTGNLSEACDELQYTVGEGPCLSALADGHPIRVDDMATDTRWPEFAPRAVELGVRSMLAVPLPAPRSVLGVLNFYAKSPAAFDDADELVAQAYGTHAGIALAHAEMEANLRIGLKTREEIGRAVGILMERHRVTATAAFDMLVVASQHSHRKLRDVATWVNETGEDPDIHTLTPSSKS